MADGLEGHRPALVDDEVAAEVGFVLEFLDVVAIAPPEDAPVQITRIIAGDVLSVLGELDGKTVVGTAMEAGPESFDDDAGAELKTPEAHEGLGIDERPAARVGGDGWGLAHAGTGAFTVSRMRVTTFSMRTPSASAR